MFVTLVAIWVILGFAIAVSGGIATCVSWIVKDLSVLCYNKVFPTIEKDLKKFEKWAESHNIDVDKAAKDIGKGKRPDVPEQSEKDEEEQKIAAEGLVGSVVKAGAKLFGKALGKSAGKGAKTVTGKVASKLAPVASKGLVKVGSKALKAIAKLSPRTAKVLKDGAVGLGKVLDKSRITMEYALAKVGDYISNAYDKADEQDKKILDVVKEDFGNATSVENLKELLGQMVDAIASFEDGNPQGEEQVVAESHVGFNDGICK